MCLRGRPRRWPLRRVEIRVAEHFFSPGAEAPWLEETSRLSDSLGGGAIGADWCRATGACGSRKDDVRRRVSRAGLVRGDRRWRGYTVAGRLSFALGAVIAQQRTALATTPAARGDRESLEADSFRQRSAQRAGRDEMLGGQGSPRPTRSPRRPKRSFAVYEIKARNRTTAAATSGSASPASASMEAITA